ncbi:MAG: FkbM family methyltransferase [Acidimicrobiales bacterium]|nr:FkbM family methyltransferase [Acidimicrobiales bacterium]
MGDVVTIKAFGSSYRIVNPGPGRVGSKLAAGEPYERRLLVDCYQLGLVGTAFDVGAHIGNHALYFAAVCGLAVHAWEPHAESREQLETNLSLNAGLRVTVHDWAAGARRTRGRFTSGMWIEFDPQRDGACLTIDRGHVQVRRIDDEVDVADLAVMKIDVEGMEADVIAGALGHIDRSRPVIYSETHTAESHDAVARFLEPLGYRMTRAIHMGSTMERWQHPKGPR